MRNFWKMKYFAKNEQKLSDFFLFIQYITCQRNNMFIMCKNDICIIYCEFKIVQWFWLYYWRCIFKQMPVIVTYYFADKLVNLFLHHPCRFCVTYKIMIIYVKMYLACCSLHFAISFNPSMSYVYIRIKGPNCNLKTCCKKSS